MATNNDWVDMPRFEFDIQGIDGSSIHFACKNVLTMHRAVICFSAGLVVRTLYSTFCHDFEFADYDGIGHFRDSLAAIRNGTGSVAQLGDEHFSLKVSLHHCGVRSGPIVNGYCSSIEELWCAPWPENRALGDMLLLDGQSVGSIRFGFRTSLVDPPFVDNAIKDIGKIIQYLEAEGLQP